MFSATMGRDIDRLALVTTKKAIRISANPDNVLNYLFRKLQKNCINKSLKLNRIQQSIVKLF